MVLTAGELTQARADLTATLPATCDIVRVVRANSEGGWTETPSTVATVACRLSAVSVRERIAGGRIAAEASHVVTLTALTDVRQEDRIVTGGLTFEVVEMHSRSEELVRRIYVREAG